MGWTGGVVGVGQFKIESASFRELVIYYKLCYDLYRLVWFIEPCMDIFLLSV